jgi:hypothetical protein
MYLLFRRKHLEELVELQGTKYFLLLVKVSLWNSNEIYGVFRAVIAAAVTGVEGSQLKPQIQNVKEAIEKLLI